MSELKVASLFEFEKVLQGRSNKLFYPKSEADKVIAELKAQKAQTEDDCAYWKTMSRKCADDNEVMAKQRLEALKRERHQKYKRCLAMAKWCRLHDDFTQLESGRLGLPQRAIFMEYRRKAMWWCKWHKRWLKIAEKFKEAK